MEEQNYHETLEQLQTFLNLPADATQKAAIDTYFATLAQQEQNTNHISTFLDLVWYIDLTTSDELAFVKDDAKKQQLKETQERLIAVISHIKANNYIDAALVKSRLDYPLLAKVGYISNADNFDKRQIRIDTSLRYRQQKYNLLHEENEGYAKVAEELASAMGIQDENEFKRYQRASSLWNRLIQYIGCFCLDPNRVLDIILDAFIENVKTDYEFFLILINLSSWKPEENRVDDDTFISNIENNAEGLMPKEGGNVFLAQLLGERIRRHLSSTADEFSESKLELLYLTSAVTVHQGLVSMCDLISYCRNARRVDKVDGDFEASELNLDALVGLSAALLEVGDLKTAKFLLYQISDIPDEVLDKLRCIFDIASVYVYARHCSSAGLKTQDQIITDTITPHFYKPRLESIPKWEKLEQIITGEGLELIRIVGHAFYRDVVSLTRLVRLGQEHLAQLKNVTDTAERRKVENPWFYIARVALLPGVSLTYLHCTNPMLVNEVWDVIKHFPYEQRFALYADWKKNSDPQSRSKLLPAVKKANLTMAAIIRRITEESYRQYGRQIGKVAHNNPIPIFLTALHWVEEHSNMITSIVEACRYLTPLSYDVITYLMLERLAAGLQKKHKSDGYNLADWISNLAVFCGQMCRKYSSLCLESILNYIHASLKKFDEYDVIFLSQLVDTMGGIQPIEILSDGDIDVLGAGDVLKKEKIYQFSDKSIRRSSRRLADALVRAKLAIPIAIGLGQMTKHFSYNADTKDYIKVTGNCVDRFQSIFIQYCDFLAFNLSNDPWATEMVLSIDKLRIDDGLPPDAAFRLARRQLSLVVQAGQSAQNTNATDSVWQPGLLKTISDVKKTLDPSIWDKISPEFYTTFWQLGLYDLIFSKAAYDNYLRFLKTESKNADSKTKKERMDSLYIKIEEERRVHEEHVQRVKTRLRVEKDHWLSGLVAERKDIVNHIWQYCLSPRLITSPDEALFCAKFIECMHEIGTVNFSTLTLYDQIFTESVQIILFSLTDTETRNYGRFLDAILAFLSSLHGDQHTFKKLGQGEKELPGFIMKWPTQQNRQAFTISKSDLINYQEFREVFHKWHCKLRNAFTTSLKSGSYMEQHNALVVLSCINKHYPKVAEHGQLIEQKVKYIIEKTKLPEMKVLAESYLGMLTKNKKHWVAKDKFFTPKPDRKAAAAAAASATTAPTSSPAKQDNQTPSSAAITQNAPNNTSVNGSTSFATESIPAAPKEDRTSASTTRLSTSNASTTIASSAPGTKATRRPSPAVTLNASGNSTKTTGPMHHPLPKKPKSETSKSDKTEPKMDKVESSNRAEERTNEKRDRTERRRDESGLNRHHEDKDGSSRTRTHDNSSSSRRHNDESSEKTSGNRRYESEPRKRSREDDKESNTRHNRNETAPSSSSRSSRRPSDSEHRSRSGRTSHETAKREEADTHKKLRVAAEATTSQRHSSRTTTKSTSVLLDAMPITTGSSTSSRKRERDQAREPRDTKRPRK